MDPTALDISILLAVVGLRLLVPLVIPRFPLPAIAACLVIDGVDQTVFQNTLSPALWQAVEGGYQGYDKALDIYYLCIAYTATFRNWTNGTALRVAQVLWLYRLAGVTLFQIVHDTSDESSWRWLLLIFPNSFEYFFIAYEVVRLRWDPRRMSRLVVVGLAAAIWIFIKLPQEWWIHVAQLDFTDVAAEHSWVWPGLAASLVALAILAWWLTTRRLPPGDHSFRLGAGPLPVELDSAVKRNALRLASYRLFDWYLLEKIVLVGLVCINFAQILPGTTATPAQVIGAVGTLVVINSFLGLAFARRSWSVENALLQFVVLVAINVGTVGIARAASSRFDPDDALFFVLLISLIVLLYDRYRPVRQLRWAQPPEVPTGRVSR